MPGTAKSLGAIVANDSKVPLLKELADTSYILVIDVATHKTHKLQATNGGISGSIKDTQTVGYQLRLKRGKYQEWDVPTHLKNGCVMISPLDNYGVGQGQVIDTVCRVKASKSGLYHILIFENKDSH